MRNKIVLVFLFSLLIPIHFSSAYIPLPSSTDIGGSANPINIQIQPDYNAQRRQENLSHESQLKIQYGYSIYSSCKSSVCGSYNAVDPFAEASCLSTLEAWLGRGMCQAQKNEEAKKLQCATGYVKFNGECISFSESCNLHYPNTIFTNYDTDGKRVCDCKSNYVWNNQRTSCVVAPVISTTNNSVSSGGGSTSAITCNGKEWNDCPAGQKFSCPSTGDAQCLITPKAVTPTTIKVPEVKILQNEVKEDTTPNITKPEPMNLNKEVTNTTTEIKPKSFWSKLKEWFKF
jgi:hypothetical protein